MDKSHYFGFWNKFVTKLIRTYAQAKKIVVHKMRILQAKVAGTILPEGLQGIPHTDRLTIILKTTESLNVTTNTNYQDRANIFIRIIISEPKI